MKKLSYSKKIYYQSIAKLLIVPIIALILATVLLSYSVNLIVSTGISITFIVSFIAGFLLRPLSDRFNILFEKKVDSMTARFEDPIRAERDSSKKGIEGENIVFKWFEEFFEKDKSWFIFKNLEFVNRNGKKYDIDLIIVGPKGIFVFEIKNLSYDFIFTEEDCAVVLGDHIRKYCGDDPRKQVSKNAQKVEELLKNDGIENINIKRAVVFARKNSFRFLGKTVVFLIDNKESLKKYISRCPEDPRFTYEFCEKVKGAILVK